MPYSIYISYSMSDSSKAYDLSGKLSREKISYYLDCVESGFTLSDYTKQIIEDCEVFVALVGARYAEAKFACDTLNHAIAHGKRIVVCLVEGTPLPELLNGYTTVNEEDLFASLMGGEDNDNDNDNDNENKNEDDNEDVYEDVYEDNHWPLTVDYRQENENENEDIDDGDRWPLTIDYRQENENENENENEEEEEEEDGKIWEHRGTIPPMLEQTHQTKKKSGGCGCLLLYAIFIFIIANFFVKTIFNEGLVELAIDHIETQIEKRK